MTPAQYNTLQLARSELTAEHVTELVRHFQAARGLEVDGMAGAKTIAAIDAAMRPAALRIDRHRLSGQGVTLIEAHPSWYGSLLTTGQPRGIVAHYTATDPGTSRSMARRRTQPLAAGDRLASWHLTIETDGSIVQMVPLDRAAWHAGSDTALPVPGLGTANYHTVGIELVGHGKDFPAAQVEAAKRLWRVLVQTYGIQHKFAMLEHSKIDPARRSDPGPVWVSQHAPEVLKAAFA